MAPPTTNAQGEKKSTLLLGVILLLLSLVGAATGFAVGAMLAPKAGDVAVKVAAARDLQATDKGAQVAAGQGGGEASQNEAARGTADASLPPLVEVQVPMVILPLPPILTNLAEPKETWIRFEGSLLMKKDTQDPSPILVEHAGEQILTFLRTVKLNQIAGPSGFLNLREDLNDVVSSASDGQVKEVLIHTMVME